jgi:hypothetical protein
MMLVWKQYQRLTVAFVHPRSERQLSKTVVEVICPERARVRRLKLATAWLNVVD